VKRGAVEHLLSINQLSERAIGDTIEDQLSWLLSFVNLGRWKSIKIGRALSIGKFSAQLRMTGNQWDWFRQELESFCSDSTTSAEEPLKNAEIEELQQLAGRVLFAIARKGVVIEEVAPSSKLVLFYSQREQKILINLSGKRWTRFLWKIASVLEGLDVAGFRACRRCKKLFYSETRRIYCTAACSNRVRQKRYQDKSRARVRSEAC